MLTTPALPDIAIRTTSSSKSKDKILRSPKWKASTTWLHLEILSIKIMNRISDKGQPWQSSTFTRSKSDFLLAMLIDYLSEVAPPHLFQIKQNWCQSVVLHFYWFVLQKSFDRASIILKILFKVFRGHPRSTLPLHINKFNQNRFNQNRSQYLPPCSAFLSVASKVPQANQADRTPSSA